MRLNLDGTGQIFGAPVTVSTASHVGDVLLVSASDIAANLIGASMPAITRILGW